MNYYQLSRQEERQRKIVCGIKIAFWCVVIVAIIAKVSAAEFADKLELGIL